MAREHEHFQRARRPEQKRLRETAILDAARELALREGVRNISLADIAAEVRMHKTALLRYFETREEIYLRLATEAWQECAQTLVAAIKALPAGDVPGVAATIAHVLDERPLLCDLLTHVPLNLERNVSISSVLPFKLAAITSMKLVSDAIRTVLPELTEQDGEDLLTSVAAVAASLYQASRPPPTLATLYVEHPDLAHAYYEFVPTLRRLVEVLVLGMRARH
jgi:AcrR family transcriptional regulator